MRQIIIANSALHMSNALHKPLISGTIASSLQHFPKRQISTSSDSSISQQAKSYSDALTAKQRALSLLKSALNDMQTKDIDIILATILLFIELELIDSGKDTWKLHMTGARKVLDVMCGLGDPTDTAKRRLRSFLISNYLMYVRLDDPNNHFQPRTDAFRTIIGLTSLGQR